MMLDNLSLLIDSTIWDVEYADDTGVILVLSGGSFQFLIINPKGTWMPEGRLKWGIAADLVCRIAGRHRDDEGITQAASALIPNIHQILQAEDELNQVNQEIMALAIRKNEIASVMDKLKSGEEDDDDE